MGTLVNRAKTTARACIALFLSILLSVYSFNANVLSAYAIDVDSGTNSVTEATSTARSDLRNLIVGKLPNETYSEYYFSDSYFDKSSKIYNASLATMSMCLAMSAGTSKSGDNDYSYGYRNADRVLNDLGFEDVEANDGLKNKPTADSIGVVTAHKTIENAKGKKDTVIAVVIRGTGYGAEWSGNTKLGETGEAEGFATARDQVIKHLTFYMNLYGGSFEGDVKIWIMGFSRASATANLTGNFLDCAVQGTGQDTDIMVAARDVMNRYTVTTDEIYCYGFEVPQGGSDTTIYKAADNTNLWCIVDPDDPVPYVAPESFGFYRYGNTVPLNYTGEVTRDQVYNEILKYHSGEAKKYSNLKLTKEGFSSHNAEIVDTIEAILSFPVTGLWGAGYKYVATKQSDAHVSSMSDYMKKLIELVSKSGISRENYANNIQPTAAAILEVFMAAEGAEQSAFLSELAKGFKNNLSYYNTFLSLVESLEPAAAALLYAKIPEIGAGRLFMKAAQRQFSATKEAKSRLTETWRGTLLYLQRESTYAGVFDEATFNKMYSTADEFIDFVYTLIKTDYDEYNLEFIGTALYYMGELISPHNTSVVTAYLRLNDPNYTQNQEGCHQVCIELPEGCSANDISVELKYTSESLIGKEDPQFKYLASFKNGALSTKKGTDAVTASVLDNKLYLTVKRQFEQAGSNIALQATVSTSSNKASELKISYFNSKPGSTTAGDPNQSFENTSIPFGSGDEITLTMRDSSVNADFEKTCTASFVYMTYSDDAQDYVYVDESTSDLSLTLNGKAVEAQSVQFNALSNNTIKASGKTASGKTVTGILEAQLDENGDIAKDENGKFVFASRSTSDSFVTVASYDTTSTKYVVVLSDPKKTVKLFAAAKNTTLDGEKSDIVRKMTVQVGSQKTLCYAGFDGKVKPGQLVTITLDKSDGDTLVGWLADSDIDIRSGSLNEYTISFIMPYHNVSLEADLLSKAEDATYAVVGGRWGAEYTSADTGKSSYSNYVKPSAAGWTEKLYLQNAADEKKSYLLEGAHVFVKNASAGDSNKLFVSTPKSYTDSNGTTYVFKEWQVTYAFGGGDCKENIALAAKATYSADGTVTGAEYSLADDALQHKAANGATDNFLIVDGGLMTQSLRFTPLYEREAYTVTKTDIAGAVQRKTALEAGTSVKFSTDRDSGDRHFANWSGTYTTVTQVDTGAGYTTDKVTESSLVLIGAEKTDLTLTVPSGDVTLTANYTRDRYLVTTTSDVTVDTGEYYYSAGDTVVLRVRGNGSKIVVGWETSDNGIVFTGVKNTYGQVDRYSFTMPNHNVTVKPVLKDATQHTLTFEGYGASIMGGQAQIKGGIVKGLYPGQIVAISPQYREGYHVNEWSISSSVSGIERSVDEDGTLYLTMPDADVSAKPRYESNDPEAVTFSDADVTDADVAAADNFESIAPLETASTTQSDTMPVPELSDEADQPGSYDYNAAVLFDDSTMASLYYVVRDSSEGAPTAAEIIESGKRYDNKAVVEGVAGKSVEKTLYAVYVAESEFCRLGTVIAEGTVGEVSAFEYAISLPSGMKYTVDVTNGTGSGTYAVGEKVTIKADDAAKGATFTNISVDGGRDLELDNYHYGDSTITFTMPAHDVEVVANYVVDSVDATVAEPVAGKELAPELDLSNSTSSVVYGVSTDGDLLEGSTGAWYCLDRGFESGVADYSTKYGVMGIVHMAGRPGYTFSNTVAATVNGQQAMTLDLDGALAFFYELDATEAAEETDEPTIVGYASQQVVQLSYDNVVSADDPVQYVLDRFPVKAIAFVDNYISKVIELDLSYDETAREKIESAIANAIGEDGFMVALEAKVQVPSSITRMACKSAISISAFADVADYFVNAPRSDGDAIMKEGEANVQLDLIEARHIDAASEEAVTTTYYFTVGSVSSSADQEYDPVVATRYNSGTTGDESDYLAKPAVAVPAEAITETDLGKEIDVSKLQEGQTYTYDETNYVLKLAASPNLQYVRSMARSEYENGHVVESAATASHYFVSKAVQVTVVTTLDGKQKSSETITAYAWQGNDISAVAPTVAAGKTAKFNGWSSEDDDVLFENAALESTQASFGEEGATITAAYVSSKDTKPEKDDDSASGSKKPAKTGDSTPLVPIVAIAVLSFLLLATALIRLRRKE